MVQTRVRMSQGAMVALLLGGSIGCSAIRVAPREPAIDAATQARITRLGCGDTAAADSVLRERASDPRVTVRLPEECAEHLGWMARWMSETFATWAPAAPRDEAAVERFALLRVGPWLFVYLWFRRAPGDAGRRGMVYEIDLRRRGEGITGFSF